MEIKGAIFDMDGTLVESLWFWDYLWNKTGVKYFNNPSYKPDKEVDLLIRTCIFKEGMKIVATRCNIPCQPEEFVDFALNEMAEFYKRHATMKDGAIELLNYLNSNGVLCCLATATGVEHLEIMLERFDLKKYFKGVLSCSTFGVGKDKPFIYEKALETLNLPSSEVCVVEDSFVAIESAKLTGVKTIGVYDKHAFNQERLKQSSDYYMPEGENLSSLISVIKVKND